MPSKPDPGAHVLDTVRASCATVAEGARWVRLRPARLQGYVSELCLERWQRPVLDPSRHYLGHGDATAGFILVLDAVNFGSGWSDCLRKKPGGSTYSTIAQALTDHYSAYGPMSAEQLAALQVADCFRIFDQDPNSKPVGALMRHFRRSLNDLGRFLLERHGGAFDRLIRSAGQSAGELVRVLLDMPYYRDVARWNGAPVAFYKRAQITASDLYLALEGHGLGRFHDLDRLTAFADNVVPHVLHVDGVLEYEESLERRIQAGELLPSGSREEVEIRAGAVHAVERIVAGLHACGVEVLPMQVDVLLWTRGRAPRYKDLPRHRTRSIYY
ncbi:MAG: hypothetical protein EYC70_00725 [Planctomycetota bacterium]|nr:MAG: hypothetical protein EYC70_00725 [Planctomycetota bacterium]